MAERYEAWFQQTGQGQLQACMDSPPTAFLRAAPALMGEPEQCASWQRIAIRRRNRGVGKQQREQKGDAGPHETEASKPGQYLILPMAQGGRRRTLRRNLQRAEGGSRNREKGARGAATTRDVGGTCTQGSRRKTCNRQPWAPPLLQAAPPPLLLPPASTQGRQETVRGRTAALRWAAMSV